MNILFINACTRPNSRTQLLAQYLLGKLTGNIHERNLTQTAISPLSADMVELRDKLTAQGNFDHPLFALAKEFAAADQIVVAAPFWDLSFPALLKIYIENINAVGVTFCYQPDGKPRGLCKAKKLYYVTSAGGPIVNDAYGYGYIKALAEGFYGIADTCCIKAENLDIQNADVEGILNQAKHHIDDLFNK